MKLESLGISRLSQAVDGITVPEQVAVDFFVKPGFYGCSLHDLEPAVPVKLEKSVLAPEFMLIGITP